MSSFIKKNLTRSAVKRSIATIALGVAVAAMSACSSAANSAGQLAADQQILAICDAAALPAADVQLDGSGSSNAESIVEERFSAIEAIVRRTAICGGRLRVSVFSATSAATAVLADRPLHLEGATDNAKLKKAPPLVAEVMASLRDKYAEAVKSLPDSGTDVSAMYRLAAEWSAQVGAPYRLHLYLLTDGFQTVNFRLDDRARSRDEAARLAGEVAVPQLPGASVLVAGLGRVADHPPASSVVDGLVAFYDALCTKTSAASCTSVTDYAVAGR
ncbi:VWA domain-containing protein [Amycolatopsis sp. CB00013]|uniref:VWA domain-containing protein n=1 Tax=Amycolatopsis sp. CB00013 TaxID=1703945 RepID=UPI00093B71F7|nr:VWA domain-containing protein [Amycolatopsis sp. CB00013]OKJ97516.1 hypothetical protein AMK34_11055 [Amycolatopsis sp. CB00013]